MGDDKKVFFLTWKSIAILSYLLLLRIDLWVKELFRGGIIILSYLLVDFLSAGADTCIVAKIQSRGRALYTEVARHKSRQNVAASLKVHKREKFFVSDFEFFTIL